MTGPDYMKFFRDRAEASKGRPDAERRAAMHAAMWEYTQAKLLVPVSFEDYRHAADPLSCGADYGMGWEWMMLEAADTGADLQQAFNEAFPGGEGGVVWRPMTRSERATAGQLLGRMSPADREKAAEIFGYAWVAKAIVMGGGMGELSRKSRA